MRQFLIIISFLPLFVAAQDVRDLVRFSETQVFGSTRFESMAGSFGALGADLSCSSINPAGYGRYSSSQFGLSLQNTSTANKAVFNGKESQTKINSFRMNNIGIVFTQDISERNKGFLYKQIGFSYNRVQNFNDQLYYEGEQYHSLLDEFCSRASGLSVDDMRNQLPFSSALAWDTYAIDPDGNGGYVPRLTSENVYHYRTVKNYGGIGEYNFNLSGNYMNKLYIGGNIGLKSGKYSEDYYHHELVSTNSNLSLDSFQYEYHLQTKGSGLNLKIGAIYLLSEQFRIGLALHSPTYFNLLDKFSADMTAYHEDTVYNTPASLIPRGEYKYRLRTPPKAVASLAYVFGTRGCINADIEYVDYDKSNLRSTTDSSYVSYNFIQENQDAQAQLRSVFNIRLGGELVFNSQYFIRAGFALYPSAYDAKINPSKGSQIISGGFGFKWKNSSLDLGFKVEHRNYNYYAFSNSLTQVNSFRRAFMLNYTVSF